MRQAATVSFLNRWPHRKIKICLFSLISDSLVDFCKTSLDLDCQFCFDNFKSQSRLQTLESPRNLGISIHEDSIFHILLVPKKRHVELSKISTELFPTLNFSFGALFKHYSQKYSCLVSFPISTLKKLTLTKVCPLL